MANKFAADLAIIRGYLKTAEMQSKSRVDMRELAKGITTEEEHKDTVGDNPRIFTGIALDHLHEVPDYYTKLRKYVDKNDSK